MNIGMTVVLSLYIILGFFGYWKYGDDALGSVTLNIPQEEILAQVTKIMFAITTWISYALQGYVTADIIWHKYLSKKSKRHIETCSFELLIRAGIVLLTFVQPSCADLSLFFFIVVRYFVCRFWNYIPSLLQICVQYTTGYGPWKIRLN
ncbi:Proton-coupled amino acid transporter-like protein [Lucilia cuprina]|nr:Proton-coupled amino acid transporter-like protein [Lucilia cuprina]